MRCSLAFGLLLSTVYATACAGSNVIPTGPGDGSVHDAELGVTDGATESSIGDGVAPDGTIPADPTLYVAPTGSGSACTLAAPCALSQVQSVLRQRNASLKADLTVTLRGGTYRLTQPLTLTAADSGSNGFYVVFSAFAGETPVLSGGRTIGGWVVHDAAANIYRAAAPAGLKTRQLYVAGVRAQRARGLSNDGSVVETATGYTAPNGPKASWQNVSAIEVVDLVAWKAFRCPLASISGQQLTVAEPCWSNSQWHKPYDLGPPSWIENALELLDEPGEWYHDRSANFVYYKPRPLEDLATAQVEAAELETLLLLDGKADAPVHHVRISGLTFIHGGWWTPSTPTGYPAIQAGFTASQPSGKQRLAMPGNVVLRNAHDVVFERNRLEQLGATALTLVQGCKRTRVVGNVVRDVSGGGIYLGDIDPAPTDARLISEDNRIDNNHVSLTGQEYYDTVGIFLGYTKGSLVEHNVVRDLPYTGISVGWGWSDAVTVAEQNEVSQNVVGYVMQRLRDGGLIYTLSNQPGSKLRMNLLHSQIGEFGALYLDQGSKGFTVGGNVVVSSPHWFLLQPQIQPAAAGNTLQNNFYDSSSKDGYCCGALGCCTDNGKNTLTNNVEFALGTGPSSWPATARTTAASAGLTAAYADIAPREIKIEAESYLAGDGVGYHDLTATNLGGGLRKDAVDIYPSLRFSNDQVVGYTQTGEWLSYLVHAPVAADYTLKLAVATESQTCPCVVKLTVDGQAAGAVTLPITGSWQKATIATASKPLTLTAGPHLLRLTFTGGFNFDYLLLSRP